MKIICENQRGEKVSFGYFPPCWVNAIDGLGAEFGVYTTKNSGQDGEDYNGSDAEKRNIVVSLDIEKPDFYAERNKLYSFFQKESPGTLYYYEGKDSKKIRYYVEKVTPSGSDNDMIRSLQISLICPDPKFYAITDKLSQFAVWEGRIKFPLHITEPFVVTEKVNTLIGNIFNESAVTMGITVKFTASGPVVNPSLYDIARQELMQINTSMTSGNEIVITTGTGNKRVMLTSGGLTTNINNKMAYPPKWLQAYPGDNLFRYDAESGIDNLSVSILSTQAYWGT